MIVFRWNKEFRKYEIRSAETERKRSTNTKILPSELDIFQIYSIEIFHNKHK